MGFGAVYDGGASFAFALALEGVENGFATVGGFSGRRVGELKAENGFFAVESGGDILDDADRLVGVLSTPALR